MPAEPHHTDVDNKENNMTAVTADVGQEKKGKGTEEVPEEPPYTAVLGQDKTEKYYYVAPVAPTVWARQEGDGDGDS